jgi:hypothetical protein
MLGWLPFDDTGIRGSSRGTARIVGVPTFARLAAISRALPVQRAGPLRRTLIR